MQLSELEETLMNFLFESSFQMLEVRGAIKSPP